ncbi:MAG: hypothetical protein Q6L58_09985 [Thermostichales cyanobacterium BF3_bins_165]
MTGWKSNLLLAAACLAAIAAVGCVFELSSGDPDYGVGVTAVILAVTAPLTVVFFLWAVKIARAEQQ